MNTASILGVQFHAVTKQQAVELAMSKIRSRQKGYVVTPNPEIVDLCRHDEKFMGVVNHATLVLPDGIGIIYAAKILGEKLHGKVAGIEFAESLVAAMAKENMRLYLLGAKPGVAEKAGANLCAKYPGLVLAGTHDGYFSDPQEVVDSINAAGGADVVFVCHCGQHGRYPQHTVLRSRRFAGCVCRRCQACAGYLHQAGSGVVLSSAQAAQPYRPYDEAAEISAHRYQGAAFRQEGKVIRMKVKLLAYTPDPEKLVAAAAKNCYSSTDVDSVLDGLTEEKTESFVNMLSEIGHESPIEHVSFTFAIEGVSRSLLAQITRHRIASFSVQSQRYVREKGFEYVVPPEIDKIPAARAKFIQAMEDDQRTYEELTAVLMEGYLKELLEQGVPEKTARSKAEKHAIEDARYVLPNACATRIVMTANARSLKNFFRLRCCNRAQWEIRALAEEMYKQVYAVAPTLFGHCGPACVDGVCTEGKMSCGKAAEVRAHYQTLREGK